MEDLFKPDVGVMLLTICNFLLLVYLLKKFAWKGIIGALEKREEQIAQDKQRAQEARLSAEKLQAQLESKLSHIAQEAADKIAQAVKTAEAQREQLLAAAQEQSGRMIEQAREQIRAEQDQALAQVREELVSTALLAAEKITQQEISPAAARNAVERVLDEVKR